VVKISISLFLALFIALSGFMSFGCPHSRFGVPLLHSAFFLLHFSPRQGEGGISSPFRLRPRLPHSAIMCSAFRWFASLSDLYHKVLGRVKNFRNYFLTRCNPTVCGSATGPGRTRRRLANRIPSVSFHPLHPPQGYGGRVVCFCERSLSSHTARLPFISKPARS